MEAHRLASLRGKDRGGRGNFQDYCHQLQSLQDKVDQESANLGALLDMLFKFYMNLNMLNFI